MGKKRTSDGKGELKASRSSADLCKELGVEDVDLEYTSADFQNLTTYSLFIRMVRPQILAANDSKMSSGKLSQLMDAKWREFQAGKLEFEKAEAAEGEEEQMEEEPDEREEEQMEEEPEGGEEEPQEEEPQEDSLEEGEEPEAGDKGESTELDSNATEEDAPREDKRADTGSRRSSLRITLRPTRKKLVQTDSDLTQSEEEKPKRKTPSRRKAYSSDEEPRARSRNSRKKPVYLSSGSESPSSSDSGPSRRRGRKRKPEKPSKPMIPGERKSDRQHKKVSDILGDREFEKMLREEAKGEYELEQEKKDKRNKKRKKMKRMAEAGSSKVKKGYWQGEGAGKDGKDRDGDGDGDGDKEKEKKKEDKEEKEGGESGNDSDHYWFCQVCKDGGDLILCDTCPKSFHQDCLKIQALPDGDWSCPLCTGEGLPEEDSEEEDDHDLYCKVCRDGGDVILCDYCVCVFHLDCLNPPLSSAPEGDWKCPRCVIIENPLKAKVTDILFWRWSNPPADKDELDHSPTKKTGPSLAKLLEEAQIDKDKKEQDKKKKSKKQKLPSRELFVKFEFHSYFDCEWISELQMEVLQPLKWGFFCRKWDMDEPPALEDGSSFGRIMHKTKSEDDKHNLQERYYRYGVKPEWLQIHRIVTHEHPGGSARYLVKWRDLQYTECTWEYPDDLPEGLENWQKHVDAYHARRKERMKPEKSEKKKKPKLSKLRNKMVKQPSYLGVEGCTLHPYQLEGLNWMRFSFSQDTNTILADEMGLGKTIQAISFIYSLWKEGYSPGPFLITAPLSTVANWEREFELWAPDMYIVTYTGHHENRSVIREREFSYRDGAFAILAKPSKMKESHKPKFDVLLTSYEFPTMDVTCLSSIQWSVLVIDEAHRLKNQQSLFFRMLSRYKLDYRLLLTGTPLQNNLEELFNLLAFLEPTKFTDLEAFLDEFAEISKDEQVSKLHDMLAPHMLRRMKIDVLKDLPSKMELIVRVELSASQKKYYKMVLTKNYEALNARGYKHQTSLMNIMMDLRKCCNHPYLFPAAERDAPISNDGRYEGAALIKSAGKLSLLAKMLKVCKRDNHRVLIFSQMTRVLDILEDFLYYCDYGYERIDGSVMGAQRQASIDRFNCPGSTKFVFLLSTKAGGLGINLATADTVIIYDMDWNPHNDIQAFSRAHRIGQKNKVMIYRFVSKSSVEEKMTEVCKKKMMLSELIIHRGGLGSKAETKTDSITKQEINDILRFGAEELFKDSEEGNLVYDEAAVEALMDRSSKQGEEEGEEKGEKEIAVGLNEYLRSFKVASYKVKEGLEEEEEAAAVVEEEAGTSSKTAQEEETPEDVRDYWKRVLGDAYDGHIQALKAEEQERVSKLGKGKRIKKKINYSERELLINQKIPAEMKQQLISREEMAKEYDDDMEVKYLSDYVPESEESVVESDESADDDVTVVKTKDKPKSAVVNLPPLLAKVNGHIEVLGFSARQRRAFLDAVMRFGLPPDDTHISQWQTRDLYKKPEKIFRAYISLFMRHLCEPSPEGAETYADGVPKEGLSRQHVMTRIGVISLIRRKVLQYEAAYDVSSLEEYASPLEPLADGDGGDREKEEGEIDLAPDKTGKTCSNPATHSEDKAEEGTAEKTAAETAETGRAETGRAEEGTRQKEEETEGSTETTAETDKQTTEGDTADKTNTGEVPAETETPEDSTAAEKMETTASMEGDQSTSGTTDKTEDQSTPDTTEKTGDQSRSGTTDKAEDQSMPGTTDKTGDQSTPGTPDKTGDQANSDQNGKVEEMGGESEKGAGDGLGSPGHSDRPGEDTQPEDIQPGDTKPEGTQPGDTQPGDTKPGEEDSADTKDVKMEEDSTDTKPSEQQPGAEDMETEPSTDQETTKKDPETSEPKTDMEAGDSTQDTKETSGASDNTHDTKETSGANSECVRAEQGNSTDTKEDTAKMTTAAETGDTKTTAAESKVNLEKDNTDSKDLHQGADKEDSKDSKDSTKVMEVDAEKDTQVATPDRGEKDEHSKESADKDSKDGEKGKDDLKDSPDKKEETRLPEKGKKEVVHAANKERKLYAPSKDTKETLRKKFWVADGGFTELHAIWQYEEQFLKDRREFLTWHRRHDYWLLAGIITHGYRQWHDLLNDPRFAILTRAFRTDMERQRKAAFLNRRFQLLEQALVIEEQLRKAMIAVDEDLSDSDEDLLKQLDTFGDKLKQLSLSLSGSHDVPARQAAPSAGLKKAMSDIMTVVGDMKSMTYSQIPATLSTANPGVVQLMQAKIAREKAEKAAKANVICID